MRFFQPPHHPTGYSNSHKMLGLCIKLFWSSKARPGLNKFRWLMLTSVGEGSPWNTGAGQPCLCADPSHSHSGHWLTGLQGRDQELCPHRQSWLLIPILTAPKAVHLFGYKCRCWRTGEFCWAESWELAYQWAVVAMSDWSPWQSWIPSGDTAHKYPFATLIFSIEVVLLKD